MKIGSKMPRLTFSCHILSADIDIDKTLRAYGTDCWGLQQARYSLVFLVLVSFFAFNVLFLEILQNYAQRLGMTQGHDLLILKMRQ